MKPKLTNQSFPLQTKSFLLSVVTVSSAVWHLSFNFGAFGTIFFGQIFTAWAAGSATFLGCLLLPQGQSPVGRWGLIIMAEPTLSIILALSENIIANPLLYLLQIASGIFSYVVSLPYSIYVVFSITQEDIVKLSRRMKLRLVTIAAIICMIGYFIGNHNYLFLSCYDFQVSGYDLPANCRQESIWNKRNREHLNYPHSN